MTKVNQLRASSSMEITRLAKEKKAKGETVYTLSIGDNHFNPPKEIANGLNQALLNGDTHYTNAKGIIELRTAICKNYNEVYTSEEMIVTPGVKQGLFNLLTSISHTKIAVLEPTWLGYRALVTLTDKEYIAIDTNKSSYLEDIESEDFEVLIMCAPNNPNGRMYTAVEVDGIYSAVKAKNATLVVDEIYKEFIYEGSHKPIENLYGKENVIIFNGFSKSHAMTGLRIGYCLSKNQQVIKDMVKVQQNVATCTNSLAQRAAVVFDNCAGTLNEFREYYAKNRALVTEIFPELEPFKPNGGFYYYFSLKAFNLAVDGESFCKDVLAKKNVALVPGNAYGDPYDQWIRLSFSMETSSLENGLLKLKAYINEIKNS